MMTMSLQTSTAPVMWKIILKLEQANFKILTQVRMWDGE
jgi:hypothetical protein